MKEKTLSVKYTPQQVFEKAVDATPKINHDVELAIAAIQVENAMLAQRIANIHDRNGWPTPSDVIDLANKLTERRRVWREVSERAVKVDV